MMFSEWDKWAKRVGAYPICNDGYGYRAQGSRRFINGTFDDNFGHWNLHAKILASSSASTIRFKAKLHISKSTNEAADRGKQQ